MKPTKSIKKVLIAIDYDPTAEQVAEKGFLFAKSMDAEVILLHVIADPDYYSLTKYNPIMGFTGYVDIGPLQLDVVENLKKASQLFLDQSKSHLGDENIQTLVKEGSFAECILETSKELAADIIVLGSHSRRWLENIVMGSVTEKVLHHAATPLLIIPTGKH
ncbi:MAG TPA: universal stress protein [Puia sp.]|nr:universal stress protein [Puia sp.]